MNILVCDDHQLILEGIGAFLERKFPESPLFFARSKAELIDALNKHQIDILLQDVRLGREDAREFIKDVKVLQPEMKIIVVSTLSDASTVRTLMNQGVDGYVIKVDGLDEISNAIEHVRKGENYLSAALKESLIHSNILQDKKSSDSIELTRREREVLTEILNEKSTKEIADTLFISEKTVENHRSNLFIKFDVKNVSGLVKKAILMGYLD